MVFSDIASGPVHSLSITRTTGCRLTDCQKHGKQSDSEFLVTIQSIRPPGHSIELIHALNSLESGLWRHPGDMRHNPVGQIRHSLNVTLSSLLHRHGG